MVSVTFRPLRYYGRKSGMCPKCGKPAKRRKIFEQTLNPFNRNKSGEIKTPTEIYDELRVDLRQWESEPVYHAKCEVASHIDP
jgi:hypothetical protein